MADSAEDASGESHEEQKVRSKLKKLEITEPQPVGDIPPAMRVTLTDREREAIVFAHGSSDPQMVRLVRAHFGARLTPRYDDAQLRRFVLARKFQAAEVLAMVEADLAWRRDFATDTILDWLPKEPWFETAFVYWPGRDCGADRYGIPVYWVSSLPPCQTSQRLIDVHLWPQLGLERTGLVDTKSLCAGLTLTQITQLHVYFAESAEHCRRMADIAQGREAGKWIEHGLVMVFDCAGMGMGHMYVKGLQTYKAITALDEAHYPNALRKVYMINAPRVANALFRMVRPWLDPETAAKVQLFSAAEDYLPTFTAEFGDQIPDWAGGSLTHHGIGEGGLYPMELSGCQEVTIGARQIFKRELQVDAKMVVSWKFRPVKNDINFRLVRRSRKRAAKERLIRSVDRATHWECGTLELTPGHYSFVWDNSFSWVNSKIETDVNEQDFAESETTEASADEDDE